MSNYLNTAMAAALLIMQLSCSTDDSSDTGENPSNTGNGNPVPLASDEINHDANASITYQLSAENYQQRIMTAVSIARAEQLTTLIEAVERLGIDWESGNHGLTRDGESVAINETFNCGLNGQVAREYQFESATSLNYRSTFIFTDCEDEFWRFNGSLTRDQKYQFAGHGSVNTEIMIFNAFQAVEKTTSPGPTDYLVTGQLELMSQVSGFTDEYRLDVVMDQFSANVAGVEVINAQQIEYQQRYLVASTFDENEDLSNNNYFQESLSINAISIDGASTDSLSTIELIDYRHDNPSGQFRGFGATPRAGQLKLTNNGGSSVEITIAEDSNTYTLNNQQSTSEFSGEWIAPTRCHSLTNLHHDTCRLNQP